MTKLQAIREFVSFVLGEYVTIARNRCDGNNWAMDTSDKKPRLMLPETLDLPMDDGDIAFRKNFIERCPIATDFSDVTLTLLHECGHWATRAVMDIVEYDKDVSLAYTHELYMTNPWEMLATQWAICWLLSPVDQEQAHKFEEHYYGRD